MGIWKSFSVGLLLSGMVIVGCSSDSGGGGGGGTCDQYSGSWDISGTCASSACNLVQNGCSFTLSCDDGTVYNGNVDGSSMHFSNSDTSCSGTVSGTSASGSCSTPGGSCSWSAVKN